jgi:uncharacterized membrane protein
MKLSLVNALTLAVLLLLCGLALWYQPLLPDPVPTHWDALGQPDGWTPKPWGVWMMPAILGGLTVILFLLPVISPHGFRLDEARRAYDVVVLLIVGFIAAIAVAGFESARDGLLSMATALPWLLGLLFILLGNYLPKFPKNFFVGIRTPWTLASDEVWIRTHRLGGWLFIAAGIFTIVAALFGMPLGAGIAAIVLAALLTALYSLLLYRKWHGFDDEPR